MTFEQWMTGITVGVLLTLIAQAIGHLVERWPSRSTRNYHGVKDALEIARAADEPRTATVPVSDATYGAFDAAKPVGYPAYLRRTVEPPAEPACICGPTYVRADCPKHGDPAALTAAARPPVTIPLSDHTYGAFDPSKTQFPAYLREVPTVTVPTTVEEATRILEAAGFRVAELPEPQVTTVGGLEHFPTALWGRTSLGRLDTSETLSRCPFCGYEAGFREVERIGHDQYTVRVECTNTSCMIGTPMHYETREKAAAAWNRRAENRSEKS